MAKLFVLLTVLVSATVAGIKDLKLSLDFDAGYIPKAASREYKTPIEDLYKAYAQVLNTQIKLHLEYKFVYTTLSTFSFSSLPKSGHSFWPFRTTYNTEFGIYRDAGPFRFSLGYEHNCSHRIITTVDGPDKTYRPSDNGYDNIFIRFHYANFP